jgi:predicted DNA-binding transcriptional regulator AlpA
MPRYLTPDQVIAMLPGLSRGQLAQLRYRGAGPAYRKPTPKTVLYVESEVIEWVEGTKGSCG